MSDPESMGMSLPEVSPEMQRLRELAVQKRERHQKYIEAGRIIAEPIEFEELTGVGRIIQQTDFGKQAIVLNQVAFNRLGPMQYVTPAGDEDWLDPEEMPWSDDPDDCFYLYRWDVGLRKRK